jgi:hypothetical protein
VTRPTSGAPLAATLVFALCGLAAPDKRPSNTGEQAGTAIAGGLFEASGVTAVPDAGGVLFVDDNTPDAVFWMQIDAAGAQIGDAVRVPLGVEVVDMEGITCDGDRFYVVGSPSKKETAGAGLVRFRFDAARRSVSDVERVDGLAAWLLAEAPELAALGASTRLNVEGLAWDAAGGRLLLGLRAPLGGADAIVVPLEIVDATRPLSATNLRAAKSVIRLSLGGQAIRGIEAAEGGFLVVTGASDGQKRTDFGLWRWDGRTSSGVERIATLDRALKPEGVVPIGGAAALVVCDVGRVVVVRAAR